MLAFAPLLLAQSIPWVYADDAASKKAVQIFKEACTQGALKLSPERGRILEQNELTDFTSVLQFFRATKNATVIKFNDPRGTFLVFADYVKVQAKGLGRQCIVVSRVLSLNDALAALIETAPDREPRRTWIPNMYLNGWTIDAPDRGFRASVGLRSDRSVIMEIGTYGSAMDSPSAARNR